MTQPSNTQIHLHDTDRIVAQTHPFDTDSPIITVDLFDPDRVRDTTNPLVQMFIREPAAARGFAKTLRGAADALDAWAYYVTIAAEHDDEDKSSITKWAKTVASGMNQMGVRS